MDILIVTVTLLISEMKNFKHAYKIFIFFNLICILTKEDHLVT